MINGSFDPSRYRWREVTGDLATPYRIRHDYTVLGCDLAVGTLDMVVRCPKRAEEIAARGAGSLDVQAAFIPTRHGTNAYVDELF